MRNVQTRVIILAIIASCDCGGDRGSANGPTPVPSGTTGPAFLDALVDVMRRNSINTSTIDWEGFRAAVFAASGAAQQDTDRAVAEALSLLNDEQSYFQRSNGQLIGPSPVGGCGAGAEPPPALPESIGYVKIDSCDCQGRAADQFAESIQRAIRAADRPGLTGWIVDLRGNLGGNMWPMIAGIGPVLGEGIVGWIVYNDREYEREYIAGAAQSLGEPFSRVADPYTLMKPYPKVAVLTDNGVASAAEALVVFFKGRPLTRSFGSATCGHHHLQQAFPMGNGTLHLAVSQHADRTKRRYASRIEPDETAAAREIVNRAIRWLEGGS
jgi:hypothetical protein